MRVGLHHDAAAYCGEDTLVPVAFLPVSGIACLLPFIAMPRVLPLEDCDVTDIVEELRRARLSDFLATVEASGYFDVPSNSWFARGPRPSMFRPVGLQAFGLRFCTRPSSHLPHQLPHNMSQAAFQVSLPAIRLTQLSDRTNRCVPHQILKSASLLGFMELLMG